MDCGLQRRSYPARGYAAQPRVARPSRATPARQTTDDSDPERIVQNGPPVLANERSHDVANARREFTFYRTPFRVRARISSTTQGSPTFVGLPWAALQNAFSVEKNRDTLMQPGKFCRYR